MRKGAEGHVFHGSSGPGFDPHQYYIFKDGRMHCGLTVVAWQLADVNPGDGGLCLIPGSHKGNFACPPEMKRYEMYQEHIRQVTGKAGDVVIFTEATTHGTLPWKADHQRRSLLFRYSPGNLAYAKGYFPNWPQSILEGLTPEQRAVLRTTLSHTARSPGPGRRLATSPLSASYGRLSNELLRKSLWRSAARLASTLSRSPAAYLFRHNRHSVWTSGAKTQCQHHIEHSGNCQFCARPPFRKGVRAE